MQTIILSIAFMIAGKLASNQNDIVQWTHSAKKISDNTYEIQMTAKVQSPWHIYSQTTPDGGPLPTSIKFSKNPLVTFTGQIKETGKMLQKHEEVFGVDVKYFDGNVVFTQTIKLKGKVKTTLNGTIEFMACNDEQCLPPTTINFSIPIQ